jgi:hypothetical protein
MQIRGEVRRVVEYETKSQKVKNPGFWFQDRDMNKAARPIAQKIPHLGRLETRRSMANPLSAGTHLEFQEGESSLVIRKLGPDGHQSTVNAAGTH